MARGRNHDRHTFTESRALLCEGASDEAFFRALIAARGLPAFSIRNCADSDPGGTGGIDKFGRLLEAMAGWTGFDALDNILIVADADQDPRLNFRRVTDQIARSHPDTLPEPQYGVPSDHLETAPGKPAGVSVLILPWIDRAGNLESLCLAAARDAAPRVARCVDDFAACVEANRWPDSTKSDKMMLSVMISGQHHANPALGLGPIWTRAPHLVPLAHPCFDPIAAVLERFR